MVWGPSGSATGGGHPTKVCRVRGLSCGSWASARATGPPLTARHQPRVTCCCGPGEARWRVSFGTGAAHQTGLATGGLAAGKTIRIVDDDVSTSQPSAGVAAARMSIAPSTRRETPHGRGETSTSDAGGRRCQRAGHLADARRWSMNCRLPDQELCCACVISGCPCEASVYRFDADHLVASLLSLFDKPAADQVRRWWRRGCSGPQWSGRIGHGHRAINGDGFGRPLVGRLLVTTGWPSGIGRCVATPPGLREAVDGPPSYQRVSSVRRGTCARARGVDVRLAALLAWGRPHARSTWPRGEEIVSSRGGPCRS
jgi:hypothetical protein